MPLPPPEAHLADDPILRREVDTYVAVARLTERVSGLQDLIKTHLAQGEKWRGEVLTLVADIEARVVSLEHDKIASDARLGLLQVLGGGAFAIVLTILGGLVYVVV